MITACCLVGGFLGDPVDRSLIYCFEHKIPRGKENPPLQAPLFMPELLASWRQKLCLQYVPAISRLFLELEGSPPKNAGYVVQCHSTSQMLVILDL